MEVVNDDSNDSVQLPLDMSGPLLQSKYEPTELQQQIFNGDYPMMNGHIRDEYQPRIIIVEQPQQRGFRFRYECEGPSHGGLQGEKSRKNQKSYPAIRVENYSGSVRMVVTLVTDETVPKHHAHKLVGKNCNNGICAFDVKAANQNITFPNLCVLHVTRKKASEVLEKRIMESMLLDKRVKLSNLQAEVFISDQEKENARKQAREQAKSMSLNVVRLCFQVYLIDENDQYSKLLPSVISQPIYDSKSPGASALKICRMDKYGGCCTGNEEVFLLCERVQKDDIQVRFVEYNDDESIKWEDFGNFGPLDVHRQYAIVFRTPAYRDTKIEKAVNVMIMLQRKSDGEVSEPKAFTYYPQNLDKDGIARKKRKIIPPLDGFPPMFTGGGFGAGGGGGGEGGGNGGFGRVSREANRVILPNGNVVKQEGNVPAMVDEAIKACFDENPSEYNPMDDYLNICNDLEVDSEPFQGPISLKQHERFLQSQNARKEKLESKTDSVTGAMKNLSMEEEDRSQKTESTTKLDSPTESGKDDTMAAVTSVTQSGVDVTRTRVPPDSPTQSGSESSKRKTAAGSPVQSCKETECKVVPSGQSDGARTDEGFSETSSSRGDASPQHRVLSQPRGSNPAQLTSTKPAKKLEAMRIAQRTVSALRDYAETSDIRYLLLVQRHLAGVSNENGDLPLHLAVINNQAPALQCLLDVMATLPNAKKKINACNLLRQTPLHLAVVTQQSNAIEILLHAGADPSLADRHGNTPAHLAVLNQSPQCLQSLVKYLRPGVTANKPFPELNYLNYEGFTPVHLAAQHGDVAMLRTLVYGQANVNVADGKSGRTALHHAVEADDLPMAGYLLMETNADVNSRCFDGNTALHIACGRNLVGMVALLMTAGADPDIENEEIPSDESDNDVEEEGEEHSGGSWNRRGLTPADYVQDNERIMRVLEGDMYQSNSCPEFDLASDDLREDSGPATPPEVTTALYKSHHESGLGSLNIRLFQQGDLEKMDFLSRIELSGLLDARHEGKDVFTLAEKLGFTNLQNTLQGMDTSPTRFLFDYYEANDGTVTSCCWKVVVLILELAALVAKCSTNVICYMDRELSSLLPVVDIFVVL
ncbi:nuclear factor NF-kappa-B p105 subunit-like [Gigantopelta aegis]|uniref:nuclear factor NF-kappa-B p105 subunit-like n=1 Tax=Gigantopelta aegis TaxID=1735272 RepID=UPI001B889825|nr:nuclear factor NF-kappa-B p105 subunit-like [Gigantopelta aegis]